MSAVLVSRWPLTARDEELSALAQAWGSRQCRGIAVYGPAGVGKTRLAEEFLAGFAGQRVRTGRATASVAAGAVPLGAIAHLLPVGVDLSDPVRGFAEVARVLAGPGRDRRWAVMVDDLHLLDAASAVLLRQLIDAGVVRLIATIRTGAAVGEAAALLTSDAMHRVDLEPFAPGQVETVLQAALRGPVARRTAHQLAAASGGNALYLRELVLGALTDGSLAWDGEIWHLAEDRSTASTPRLAELIEARLAGVESPGRGLLELLAVCGPVALADARAVVGDATSAVEELEQAGLARVTTGRHRTVVALGHPLYGDTLRNRLPVLRRRQLLQAQADRVRAYGARRREDALHIATWQLAATGTAEPALLARAAALARHAHDYPQALTLLEALPQESQNVQTRLLYGEVLFELGQPERAEQVFGATGKEATSEQEVLAVALAHSFSLSLSSARVPEALAVNAAARARITSEHRLRVLRHSDGSMMISSCDPVNGLPLLEDLEADIHDASDPAVWLMAARMKALGLEMIGRGNEGLALTERTHRFHLAVDDRVLQPHPAFELVPMAWVLRGLGRLDEARTLGEQGYLALTEAGATLPRAWTAIQMARAEWLAGHPVSARRWYADAAAQARAVKNLRTLGPALYGLAACAGLLGDLDAAEQTLAEARPYPASTGFGPTFEIAAPAWVKAAHGDLGGARTLLAEIADAAHQARLLSAESMFLTDIARLGGAKEVAGRLAALALVCDGPFAQARAHLASGLASGDPDQLIAAADEFDVIGSDLLAAEAAASAAAAYLSAGSTRKATAATQRAQALAAHCQEIRTPLLSTAATAGRLTLRERDVALLAAHGTPSKDIADTLHLSVRTVENHLQHAYIKLGVTTRRELAQALDTHSPKNT